ncbi:hypothetical protein ABZ646_32525 [Streptomyces sp. NPDC007162]|uniref:hypothetical protein n=1 Tax=Streptomyces sp. NPDC007162 TaxID=3156917 RepID=UPI0033F69B44
MKNWREETRPVAGDAEEVPLIGCAEDVPLVGGDEPGGAGAGGAGAWGVGLGPGGFRVGGGGGVGAGAGEAVTEALRAAPSRNPWSVVEAAAGRSRVPDRVSVEHDVGGVRIRPGAREISDAPASADVSGRRSRRFRRIGMAIGLACAVYAVVIVVTLLSGGSDAPWLPVPGQHGDQPAGRVENSPAPAGSARSSDGGSSVAGPAVSDGTTPSADASPRASGTGTPGAARPSASTSVKATLPAGVRGTGSSPDPGASSADVSPTSSSPSPDTPASPSASPSADPSESTAPTGSGPGTGTVAEGPVAAPPPVPAERPAAVSRSTGPVL